MRMPDLVGRSRLAVYRTMRHDGLYFVTDGPGAKNAHWSAVTAQSPRPGVVVAWHSEATLTVRDGAAPHAARAVPRLIGRSRQGVYSAMRSAQLYFKTVGPGSTGSTWTVALSQSPRPGTKVPWHSTVVVHVSTHRPVTVVKTQAPSTPTPTSDVAISGADFKLGVATWYDYTPGDCATWYLPKGTRITVLDLGTGRSITCTITDRESHSGNHVVDLNETQFAQLEPLAKGVISVKVSW
jgi:PASTA domain